MNTYRQIPFVLLLAFLCGCGSKYTSAKPEAKNLDGVYQPTSETLAAFAKQGYAQTNIDIVLHGDGKFELRNMPDCWLSSLRSVDEPQKSYDSGSGKWVVTDNGADGNSAWGVTFEFENTTNIVSIKRKMRAILVVGGTMVKNENAPYLLHFFIGDPDSSPLCEFRVAPPAKK